MNNVKKEIYLFFYLLIFDIIIIGENMKKFIKIIFSLSLFFIFNVIVYADKFSWTCEYIVDGQTVQYSIKNLDAKYLKGSQKRTEK